jgi:hypothetical protein
MVVVPVATEAEDVGVEAVDVALRWSVEDVAFPPVAAEVEEDVL